MAFKHALKRIPSREWHNVTDHWRRVIREHEDIGDEPPVNVLDIVEQNRSLLPLSGTETEHKFDIPDIHQVVLREGIYLLHKSAAFLRSASRDINARQYTHPEITTYTASYFSAKAICLLLGVWFSPKKIANHNWFLDCFNSSNTKQFTTHIIRAQSERLGHQQTWSVLQRLLTISKGLPLDPPLIDLITQSNVEQFARNRNSIQYFNPYWFYDDLHNDGSVLSGWLPDFDRSIYSDIDPEDPTTHFNVLFCLLTVRAGFQLLSELSALSDSVRMEADLFLENVSNCEVDMHVTSWLRTTYA